MKQKERFLSSLTAASVAFGVFAAAMPQVSAAEVQAAPAAVTADADAEPVVTTTPYTPEYEPWITDEEGHTYYAGTNALYSVHLVFREFPQMEFAVGEEFNTKGLQVFMIEERRFNEKDYDVTPVLNIETDYDPNTEGKYTVWLSTDYQNGDAYTDDVLSYEVTVSSAVTTAPVGDTETIGTVIAETTTETTTFTTITTTETYDTANDVLTDEDPGAPVVLDAVEIPLGGYRTATVCPYSGNESVISLIAADEDVLSDLSFEYSEDTENGGEVIRVHLTAGTVGETTVTVELSDGRLYLIPVRVVEEAVTVDTANAVHSDVYVPINYGEATAPIFDTLSDTRVTAVEISGDAGIEVGEPEYLDTLINLHITAQNWGTGTVVVQLNDSSVYVLHVHAEPVFTTTESTEISREADYNLAVGETAEYCLTCVYDNDAQTWLTDVRPQFDVVGDALKVTDAGVKWVSGAPVNVLAIEGAKTGFVTLSVKIGGEWYDTTYYVYHDYNPTGTMYTGTTVPQQTNETKDIVSVATNAGTEQLGILTPVELDVPTAAIASVSFGEDGIAYEAENMRIDTEGGCRIYIGGNDIAGRTSMTVALTDGVTNYVYDVIVGEISYQTAITSATADTVPTTAEISVDLTTSTSTAVSTVMTEEASTESSATMTSSETLTDDSGAAVSSTSEESGSGDLPQTGNNNPAEMILAAAAMLLGAAGAAYVFGVKLRRREE